MQKTPPILYDQKEDCCGCAACFDVCLQHAITMMEDEEGFLYPKIDFNRCIRCHLCENVCAIKKELLYLEEIRPLGDSTYGEEIINDDQE